MSVFLRGVRMCKYLIEVVFSEELLDSFCGKAAVVVVADLNMDFLI